MRKEFKPFHRVKKATEEYNGIRFDINADLGIKKDEQGREDFNDYIRVFENMVGHDTIGSIDAKIKEQNEINNTLMDINETVMSHTRFSTKKPTPINDDSILAVLNKLKTNDESFINSSFYKSENIYKGNTTVETAEDKNYEEMAKKNNDIEENDKVILENEKIDNFGYAGADDHFDNDDFGDDNFVPLSFNPKISKLKKNLKLNLSTTRMRPENIGMMSG